MNIVGNTAAAQIHERTISLRFLGIILRVLILEVSLYKVYITNQFQTICSGAGGNPLVEVTVNSKEENSLDVCPNTSKNSALNIKSAFSVGFGDSLKKKHIYV